MPNAAAELRSSLLADASALLASSLDYEATLANVARLTVPAFADWCVIDLVRRDGAVRRVAVVAADDTKSAIARELKEGYPERPSTTEGTGKVLKTGTAELTVRVDDAWLRSIATTERRLELLRSLGLRSNMLVPLIARGRIVGVLTLATAESGRVYGDDDLALGLELGVRIALAVDNALLFSEAETAVVRKNAQYAATHVLAEAESLYEAGPRVLEALCEGLGWNLGAFWTVDAERLRCVHLWQADPTSLGEFVDQTRGRSFARGEGLPGRVWALGEPVWIPDFVEETSFPRAKSAARVGLHTAVGFPIVLAGSVVGVMEFFAPKIREPDPDLLALMAGVGSQFGRFVERTRLRAEAEERGRAAVALDHVGDGVFLVDRDGVVRLWNPAAEAITGLRAGSVVGRPVVESVARWPEVALKISDARSSGTPAVRETTVLLDLPARDLWVSISGVEFDQGTVYAFRDLSAEMAVERLKSDFVATVSHELRTPLSAIYGAAITLNRRGDTLGEEDRAGLLAMIADEADRLARTVNDIFWTGRLETDNVELVVEHFDAGRLARLAVDSARPHAPAGATIELSVEPDLPPVAADPEWVRQVLGNLIDNAIKYSPGRAAVEVAAARSTGGICFSIRDRGLGIPKRDQGRVFEKFYRVDPDLSRGVGGTGLGLYICRELVERMGGRIWLESEEEAGSTFSFELSSAEVEIEPAAPAVMRAARA